jgi:transcriptional regulator
MLYQPPAFREDRPEILRALIRDARLAMLVSNGSSGLPDITHLPLTLAEEEGPHGTLYGHLARANPHWRRLAEAGQAVAVFRGAEAYVSPNWYPSKAEHGRVVPTWNYEAVHAEGRITLLERNGPAGTAFRCDMPAGGRAMAGAGSGLRSETASA